MGCGNWTERRWRARFGRRSRRLDDVRRTAGARVDAGTGRPARIVAGRRDADRRSDGRAGQRLLALLPGRIDAPCVLRRQPEVQDVHRPGDGRDLHHHDEPDPLDRLAGVRQRQIPELQVDGSGDRRRRSQRRQRHDALQLRRRRASRPATATCTQAHNRWTRAGTRPSSTRSVMSRSATGPRRRPREPSSPTRTTTTSGTAATSEPQG